MRTAIAAAGIGIAAILAVAVPQVSMAQPGAEFQDQGMREANGYPAVGGPHRYFVPRAYGYVFVPGRVPVRHPRVAPHRRHY